MGKQSLKLWCSELLSSILTMKIVMHIWKSSSFRTLTHTLTRTENNKNNGIYQRNGKKKRCFSLFPVVKKNEKQRFLNLITRRSSVQIWLPQPEAVIWKITESRKSTQFRYFIEAACFFIGVFALYEMVHFSKKIEFDPNLTPKHRKKNGSVHFVLFHSFFLQIDHYYKLTLLQNNFIHWCGCRWIHGN